jgi:hypothetical protein
VKTILAVLLLTASCLAQPQCKIPFTVITEDTLGNLDQGLKPKDAEWVRSKLGPKYPDLCYSTSADSTLVFFIRITPAVYHGTLPQTNTNTSTAPVSGTITDPNGNVSTISGTEQTTTTTTSQVPYSVNYGVYTLSVEYRGADGRYAVARTFQQEGLYMVASLLWGGGRGKHPGHAVLEDAVKWVSGGGLSSQVTFQPN